MASLLPPPPTIMRPRLPSYVDVEAPKPTSRLPWGLALGALGVVYGDLGTNPLFALGEAFGGEHPVGVNQVAILGVLSLIFWALTLVVTVKYLGFVMRASNDGEGGILALLALIPAKVKARVLVLVILFGAALLYGDGVVTPAISVLSAVEGLKTGAPALAQWIVPITCVILVALFMVQRRGTQDIGFVFGPVMLVWFVTIGALGAFAIARAPVVLGAISPTYAIRYAMAQPHDAFVVLGAVILCIAGGEALYADMGHFGRKPIALAWYALVFPTLVLNYFGQGAFLLSGGKPDPSAFYAIVPHVLLWPMIILSTMATVIASQALISGAYSLTQQAVQLGYSPRVTVVHTCAGQFGQIYVPEVNWSLMVACVALVAGFRSSDKLAAAYGMAVTGTMSITTLAYFVVLTRTWKWPLWKAAPLCAAFIAIDLTFVVANLRKFWDGGWVPFGIGIAVFTLFTTWIVGRKRLGESLRSVMVPLDAFLADLHTLAPHRVRGTAIFLTNNTGGVPTLLLHHFKHNQVLHETVVLLTISAEHAPFVKPTERITSESLGEGFHRVIARFG
ncbi:MAG TPA: KUP/HAK/KT family potassium transporter, partial [Polyangiaceae bacterium]|nr:KUP/HAK/KT family potassium transporter [Polyangiaceae bacterium]